MEEKYKIKENLTSMMRPFMKVKKPNFISRIENGERFTTIYKDLYDLEIDDYELQNQINRTPYQWIDAYRVVEADNIVKAVFEKRKQALIGKNKIIYIDDEKEELDPVAKENAIKLIEDFMDEMDGDAIINSLMDCIVYGISVLELLWTRNRRYPMWHQIEPRRIRKDTMGNMRVRTLESSFRGEVLHPMNYVEMLFNSRNGRYPYGFGHGRTLLKTILDREVVWNYFLESAAKGGNPFIHLEKSDFTKDDIPDLYEIIQTFHDRNGAASGKDMKITSIPRTPENPHLKNSILNRIDKEIYMLFLGETLTSQLDNVGSYAASEVANKVRIETVAADATNVSRCLRNNLFAKIIHHNFEGGYPMELVPRIKFIFGNEEKMIEEDETEKEENKLDDPSAPQDANDDLMDEEEEAEDRDSKMERTMNSMGLPANFLKV